MSTIVLNNIYVQLPTNITVPTDWIIQGNSLVLGFKSHYGFKTKGKGRCDRSHAIFSNWFPGKFSLDIGFEDLTQTIEFTCCEQFIMWAKAILMEGSNSKNANLILNEEYFPELDFIISKVEDKTWNNIATKFKTIGREIKPWDQELWISTCY